MVFQVITDYESYDERLPMLHDSIEIVSDVKTGNGVAWESAGSFKGHKFTSVWTVAEYEQDRKVVIKDLEGGIGETVLETEPLSETETLYTMSLSTKMYKPYEKDFFAIYDQEMAIIKAESERIYREMGE